jgi:hypothetical protein
VNSPCQDSSIGSEAVFANNHPDDNLWIETADLFANPYPEDDLSVETGDFLAYYYPEDDLLFKTGDDDLFVQYSAEDHLFKTRDLFTDYYYPEEDVSMNVFDPWSPTANSEDFIVSSNSEFGENPKKPRKPRYKPVERFKLDPQMDPLTRVRQAKAEDGTPIRPGICPRKKSKTCCLRDAIPPFSKCWKPLDARAYIDRKRMCLYAMNLFCCESVTYDNYALNGGLGTNCEDMRWVKDPARESNSPQDSSQGPSQIELQEIFPILQPLPELPGPNLDYCLNPSV